MNDKKEANIERTKKEANSEKSIEKYKSRPSLLMSSDESATNPRTKKTF